MNERLGLENDQLRRENEQIRHQLAAATAREAGLQNQLASTAHGAHFSESDVDHAPLVTGIAVRLRCSLSASADRISFSLNDMVHDLAVRGPRAFWMVNTHFSISCSSQSLCLGPSSKSNFRLERNQLITSFQPLEWLLRVAHYNKRLIEDVMRPMICTVLFLLLDEHVFEPWVPGLSKEISATMKATYKRVRTQGS